MGRLRLGIGLAGLSSALVALATLLQMYVDWNQSSAMGLQSISWKLRVATAIAGILTFTALVLGLYTASRAKRR